MNQGKRKRLFALLSFHILYFGEWTYYLLMLHSTTVNLASLCFYLIAFFISVHENKAKATFIGSGPKILCYQLRWKRRKMDSTDRKHNYNHISVLGVLFHKHQSWTSWTSWTWAIWSTQRSALCIPLQQCIPLQSAVHKTQMCPQTWDYPVLVQGLL